MINKEISQYFENNKKLLLFVMKEKQLSNDENISLKIEKMQLIIQNIFNLN